MVGSEFFLELQQAYDKAYTGYLDATKANRLIKRSLYRMVSKVYSGADTQKEFDELFSFIVKDETHSVTTDRLGVDRLTYEYMHLLRMAFVYTETIPTFTYSNGIYTCAHQLRTGDTLTLTGATITANNKDYVVTKVRPGKFYIDLTYVDGTLKLKRTFEASPKRSDLKKNPLHKATMYSPKYDSTHDDNFAKPNAFILDPQPNTVIVDYVMKPDIEIDVENTVVDLLGFYTEKFLYRLIDECVVTFSEESRDYNHRQVGTQTIIDNP
jgi:hypothetical protein